jgi:hypothetical protein
MNKFYVGMAVIYLILHILYQNVFVGVFKLLVIPIFIGLFSIFTLYIKLTQLKKIKRKKFEKRETKPIIDKETRLQKEKITNAIFRDYDVNVRPLYIQGKELFSYLMKNSIMRSYDVKDFKNLIDVRLSASLTHYQTYTFKNDAHEIYVKMQNINLTQEDWHILINYLYEIKRNPIKKSI